MKIIIVTLLCGLVSNISNCQEQPLYILKLRNAPGISRIGQPKLTICMDYFAAVPTKESKITLLDVLKDEYTLDGCSSIQANTSNADIRLSPGSVVYFETGVRTVNSDFLRFIQDMDDYYSENSALIRIGHSRSDHLKIHQERLQEIAWNCNVMSRLEYLKYDTNLNFSTYKKSLAEFRAIHNCSPVAFANRSLLCYISKIKVRISVAEIEEAADDPIAMIELLVKIMDTEKIKLGFDSEEVWNDITRQQFECYRRSLRILRKDLIKETAQCDPEGLEDIFYLLDEECGTSDIPEEFLKKSLTLQFY